MQLHLYYAPGTCSFVPHVALELIRETGQDFTSTLINLRNGEQLKPEYQAINPRGQVPALIVDGKLVTQVMAIIDFLNNQFLQARLLPTEAMARAEVLSTLAWMNNTVHPTFTRVFRPERFATEDSKAAVKETALEQFKSYLAEIDALVKGKQFIAGNQLTGADCYALAFIRWAGLARINPQDYANYWAYVQEIAALPVISRIMQKEGIELVTYK